MGVLRHPFTCCYCSAGFDFEEWRLSCSIMKQVYIICLKIQNFWTSQKNPTQPCETWGWPWWENNGKPASGLLRPTAFTIQKQVELKSKGGEHGYSPCQNAPSLLRTLEAEGFVSTSTGRFGSESPVERLSTAGYFFPYRWQFVMDFCQRSSDLDSDSAEAPQVSPVHPATGWQCHVLPWHKEEFCS